MSCWRLFASIAKIGTGNGALLLFLPVIGWIILLLMVGGHAIAGKPNDTTVNTWQRHRTKRC